MALTVARWEALLRADEVREPTQHKSTGTFTLEAVDRCASMHRRAIFKGGDAADPEMGLLITAPLSQDMFSLIATYLCNQEVHVFLDKDIQLLLKGGLDVVLTLAAEVRGSLRDPSCHQTITFIGHLSGQVTCCLVYLLPLQCKKNKYIIIIIIIPKKKDRKRKKVQLSHQENMKIPCPCCAGRAVGSVSGAAANLRAAAATRVLQRKTHNSR